MVRLNKIVRPQKRCESSSSFAGDKVDARRSRIISRSHEITELRNP
jgi:hypothetical protein